MSAAFKAAVFVGLSACLCSISAGAVSAYGPWMFMPVSVVGVFAGFGFGAWADGAAS
jgi:hypothetical protein